MDSNASLCSLGPLKSGPFHFIFGKFARSPEHGLERRGGSSYGSAHGNLWEELGDQTSTPCCRDGLPFVMYGLSGYQL